MVLDRIIKIPKRRSPNDADYIAKKFQKFPKLWIFSHSKVLKFFSSPHAYAYTYDAQILCVGVFDGSKKISKWNFLDFRKKI